MNYVDGFSTEILRIYGSLSAETAFFLWAIAALTLLFHVRFSKKAVTFGPTILTTLGIFATFLGIAFGLSDFDTSNVQASVPALLSGLKTAFWASVVGVGGALTLKIRDYFLGSTSSDDQISAEDVTAGDLVRQLQEIQKALVGGEDGSLISQMKLSRQDANDRLDKLTSAQTEALSKLSEMGSKTLIEALRDVVRDFNQKITEQFGDNFKELNAAVGQMLDWQKSFKITVETVVVQFQETARLTAQSTQHYALMSDQAGTFVESATALSGLLQAINQQQSELHSVTQALGLLLKESSGALPQIEQKMMELTKQLASSVADNQRNLSLALTESAAAVQTSIKSFGEGLTTSNSELNRQFGDIATKTREQVSLLDTALAEELQKSLRGLGQQLAALSEKFVADYTPLTERLRSVLEVARRV